MKFVEVNGKPIQRGQTVSTDHVITTVAVQVRHLGTLDLDSVKRLLQAKYEVVSVNETGETAFVNSNTVQDW